MFVCEPLSAEDNTDASVSAVIAWQISEIWVQRLLLKIFKKGKTRHPFISI